MNNEKPDKKYWKWALEEANWSVDSDHFIPIEDWKTPAPNAKSRTCTKTGKDFPTKLDPAEVIYAEVFEINGETAKAFLVEAEFPGFDTSISAWFPKSQCELSKDETIFCATKWILGRKVLELQQAKSDFEEG